MRESTRGWMILLVSSILIILLIIGSVMGVVNLDSKRDILADKECKNLGFEKHLTLGFRSYCVQDGIKTEVIGNCDSKSCTFVFDQ